MSDLHSGERQVAETVDGIRADHVGRYTFAAKYVDGLVLDCACGVGYGTYLLSPFCYEVFGVDVSESAIEFANQHYPIQNGGYITSDVFQLFGQWDWIVSFETIEHIGDAEKLVKEYRNKAGRLIASVPNEKLEPKTPGRFPFHHRHYTPTEFQELLESAGWTVTEWHCQPNPRSADINPGVNGRTIIAVCE